MALLQEEAGLIWLRSETSDSLFLGRSVGGS